MCNVLPILNPGLDGSAAMSALLEGSPLRKLMNIGTGVTHAKSYDHRSLKPCHNHSALSVLRENGHFSGSEDTGEQSPFRARGNATTRA